MPSIKDLKTRIASVKNTQQTTKAMKMVSAAKLRRAQEAITSQRAFAVQLSATIRKVSGIVAERSGGAVASPLISGLGTKEAGSVSRILMVVVTSDRGLCGGYNSGVIKRFQRWMKSEAPAGAEVHACFVGRRGHDYFKTRGVRVAKFNEFGGKVTFTKAKALSDWMIEEFLAGKYDQVKVVFSEFKNAITQEIVVEDFLPLLSVSNASSGLEPSADLGNYIVKPEPEALLDRLLKKHFSVYAMRVLLEAQASEHGARMSAMESATKNAGDMIRRLTLVFNKQRQAAITKELLEIVSGSEALKG